MEWLNQIHVNEHHFIALKKQIVELHLIKIYHYLPVNYSFYMG